MRMKKGSLHVNFKKLEMKMVIFGCRREREPYFVRRRGKRILDFERRS
jgi:hypothetical protein